jgi:hypothetical protein
MMAYWSRAVFTKWFRLWLQNFKVKLKMGNNTKTVISVNFV